jgi:hypothetical protein
MKLIYAVMAVIGLSACAVANKTIGPDGRQAISINCSGAALAWNQCYEKAGDMCPRGYDIISKDGDGGNAMAGGGSGWFGGSVNNTRTLFIACK